LTNTVPHVRIRDGVYQYERRVPAHIRRDCRRFAELFGSKPLFRRSLRTKCLSQMHLAAQLASKEFDALVSGDTSSSLAASSHALETPTRTVTNADLVAIAQRYYDLTAESFEQLHRRADVDPRAADELERMQYQLEMDAEAIQATLTSRGEPPDGPVLVPIEEARHVAREQNFFAPEGSEQLGAITSAVRIGLQRGFRRINELAQGEALPTITPKAVKQTATPAMTLRMAVESFIVDRKPSAKAASETRLALQQFEEVAGNKLLAAVTRDDVTGFMDRLASRKVGGKTPGSVVRHLSEHTIGKRLRLLGAAVNFSRDRGWFAGDNPMASVRVKSFAKPTDKAVMPDKRRLQVRELNRIFSHPWFTGCGSATKTHTAGEHRLQGCQYWAPVVAVLTGCRAGELGGMKLAEVRIDDPFPHLIVRSNEYRRTKNKRTRCVPILDALLELGFASYVARIQATGADRLFPDWMARVALGDADVGFPAWSNARVIRAFNRTVIPWALDGALPEGARREVTFHSLRGAFKSMLANTNGLPINIVHEIIGHTKGELDDRYIGEITIEETYPATRGCKFKGLNIPAPWPA